MQKRKILIASTAVAALTLVLVGLSSAQTGTSQTYNNTNPNNANPNGNFFVWIGNCFDFGNNQPYSGQNLTHQAQTDGSVPAPYQSYQNGYGYSYGYGPCWSR